MQLPNCVFSSLASIKSHHTLCKTKILWVSFLSYPGGWVKGGVWLIPAKEIPVARHTCACDWHPAGSRGEGEHGLGNGQLIVGLWKAVNAVLHRSGSLKDFQVTGTAVMNMDGSSLCLFICNVNIISQEFRLKDRIQAESRKANLLPSLLETSSRAGSGLQPNTHIPICTDLPGPNGNIAFEI